MFANNAFAEKPDLSRPVFLAGFGLTGLVANALIEWFLRAGVQRLMVQVKIDSFLTIRLLNENNIFDALSQESQQSLRMNY